MPSVAWSPDGQRIASASDDETVHLWDTSTGKTIFIYKGHVGSGHDYNGAVQAVAWSPNGERIASGGNDCTVQVWQAG